MNPMNGALIIDKPAGWTSHDVVARARRLLHERRVGHTGTLDPFATGVLVLLIGRATRLAQFLSGLEKEYEAIIRLGFSTDTGDVTGQRLPAAETSENSPLRQGYCSAPPLSFSESQIANALQSLRGEIDQVPPMYSAKKRQGRKLYELARRGEKVERQPVRVYVRELVSLNPTGELLKDNLDGTLDLQVRVVCSAGTYIRTLAEDFGKRLGVGAHLTELRRTRVGDFKIGSASTPDQLQASIAEESLGRLLLTPDAALAHLPAVDLVDADVSRVRHGVNVNAQEPAWTNGQQIRLRDKHGSLIAVASFEAETKALHPRVVLAPDEV
jgi:tRNA pseudouridine55 synthase